MGWIDFILAAAIAWLLLYVPGTLLLLSAQVEISRSLACSPIVSLALYCLLSIVYAAVGLSASAATLVVLVICGSAAAFVGSAAFRCARRKRSMGSVLRAAITPVTMRRLLCIVLYCAVGVAIATRFFVIPLDGPASFVQDSDNSFHLALIRSFVESGNYSSLQVSLYHDVPNGAFSLLPAGGSFYPAAWHCLCALVMNISSAALPVVANAVNYVLLALVFPTSMALLFQMIFASRPLVIALGSFLSLAFAAFPWGALYPSSGPLYPNFIGFCILPILCAVFINMVCCHQKPSVLVGKVFLVLCGGISCALAHPNVVFSAIVLLAPFCLEKIYASSRNRFKRLPSALLSGLFLSCVICIWLWVYTLPFVQATVQFEWDPFASLSEAIWDCVSLSLRIGFAQWTLAALVLIGVCWALAHKGYRWLVGSWAISCAMFVLVAATDGDLENIVAGFWYTDPYRVSINVALCGIPLAAVGLYSIIKFVFAIVLRSGFLRKRKPIVQGVACVCVLLATCLCIYRSANTAWDPSEDISAFGNIDYCLTVANDLKRDNTFDVAERAFVKRVSEIVDPKYKIYNCADDGSPFAYATDGLNLCFRRSAAEMLSTEPADAGVVRVHLDSYAVNEEVRSILRNAGIKYVLVLDYGGEPLPERCYYGYYWRAKWLGINRITDSTPGFKLLLRQGDMRLYELE